MMNDYEETMQSNKAKKRVDLSDLLIFSIDNVRTKAIDDCFSVESVP